MNNNDKILSSGNLFANALSTCSCLLRFYAAGLYRTDLERSLLTFFVMAKKKRWMVISRSPARVNQLIHRYNVQRRTHYTSKFSCLFGRLTGAYWWLVSLTNYNIFLGNVNNFSCVMRNVCLFIINGGLYAAASHHCSTATGTIMCWRLVGGRSWCDAGDIIQVVKMSRTALSWIQPELIKNLWHFRNWLCKIVW